MALASICRMRSRVTLLADLLKRVVGITHAHLSSRVLKEPSTRVVD